jgi:hypothetical protein
MAATGEPTAQTRPADAKPNTQPTEEPLVEWRFIVGHRSVRDVEQVFVTQTRPVVRIFRDGRVEMSMDLMIGGGELVSGQLSADEMERFMKALSRITHGLEGKELVFATMPATPFHEMEVRIDDQKPIQLATCMRYGELEQTGVPSVIHSSREQAWLELKGGTRYEALLRCSQPHLANRVVWLELEAEVLRAAAQSRIPEQLVRDKIPSQLGGVVHGP